MTHRIYLSGPISGLPDKNKPAFDAEEALLRADFFDIFNPQSIAAPSEETLAEWAHDYDPKGRLWQYYMKICVAEIPHCDSMRMLPHWQNSKGAVWEHRIAQMLGIPITYCHVEEQWTTPSEHGK